MPVTSLSGFPELLPAERFVELAVIDQLRTTFALHGFANIEPRVVEPLDRLAKGGEIDKEIYVLRRLQAGTDDDASSDSSLGMHFDLTVPFARYVVENAGQLQFPFRRYQIQPAWRGERPQDGRYRQFTQADVDIVGRDQLAFHHDIEVMRVMVDALDALPLPPLSLPVQQPQADPGLLPRSRAAGRHRGHPDHRQAGQAAARAGGPAAGVRRRGQRRAGRALPRAGHHPHRRHLVRGPGARARCAGRVAGHRARGAGRGGRGLFGRWPAPGRASRPTCASPAAWTTTPAPWWRSSWPATSG